MEHRGGGGGPCPGGVSFQKEDRAGLQADESNLSFIPRNKGSGLLDADLVSCLSGSWHVLNHSGGRSLSFLGCHGRQGARLLVSPP